MATFLSGAAFGAALLASGFHQPAAISSQANLDNWHMAETFVTATASSAAIYATLERLGYVRLSPRSTSPLGTLHPYGGNILGGAIFGAGLALTCAAPGTLLVQAATGVSSGFYALGGAILGGVMYSGLIRGSIKQLNEDHVVKPYVSTLQDNVGVSKPVMVIIYEAACFGIVAAIRSYLPTRPSWALHSGVTGGLLIGAAQGFSLLTRKTMMGISGSYEEVGNYISWLLKGADKETRPMAYNNIIFGLGATTGALALSRAAPHLVTEVIGEVSPVLAVLGGAFLTIGSRIAGGCTSGHGISGLSLLSTSSLVTMATTFLGAYITARQLP